MPRKQSSSVRQCPYDLIIHHSALSGQCIPTGLPCFWQAGQHRTYGRPQPLPPAGEAGMREHPGVWGEQPQRVSRGRRPLALCRKAAQKGGRGKQNSEAPFAEVSPLLKEPPSLPPAKKALPSPKAFWDESAFALRGATQIQGRTNPSLKYSIGPNEIF